MLTLILTDFPIHDNLLDFSNGVFTLPASSHSLIISSRPVAGGGIKDGEEYTKSRQERHQKGKEYYGKKK